MFLVLSVVYLFIPELICLSVVFFVGVCLIAYALKLPCDKVMKCYAWIVLAQNLTYAFAKIMAGPLSRRGSMLPVY